MTWLKKITVVGTLALLLSVVGASMPTSVFAADASPSRCNAPSFLVLNSWTAYLPCDEDTGPKLNSINDILGIVYWLVDSALKIAGILAVGWIIWSSIKFIKSQGNPSEITAARNSILQAIVGLVICMVAVGIVNFVAGAF